ncbi:MAG: hypothetical protein MK226_06540, partial [Saprospiraceae bacterium]|nr:hypothetical protein [Saprospiraceae bacterium]
MKTYNCFSVPINAPFLMILALTLSIDNLHSQSYTPRFEYYNDIGGLQASDTNTQQLQIKAQNNEIEVKEIETVRVFDYTGRVLFEGSPNSFNEYKIQLQNRLIFTSYYDRSGS